MSSPLARVVRVLLVAAVAVIATGCTRRPHEDPEAFRFTDELPAGATIHVRNLNGTIRVHAAGDGRAEVIGGKRWRFGREGYVRFVSTRVGDDVYVCAMFGAGGRCDEEGYHTSSWRPMRLFGFRFGSDAQATITVSLPPGVRLDARTTNGSLAVSGARSGGELRTVNGSITMDHAGGSFAITSVNGSIRAVVDSMATDDTVALQTTNGSVRATLPSSFAGAVSLSSVHGGLRTNFPITTTGAFSRRKLEGRAGTTAQRLQVRTVNGAISLDKRSG